MAASGCCGPMGCGVGCSTGCNDCSGASVSGCGAGQCRGGACGARGGGLFPGLRNARSRLICGSGCGEAYIGEWISTPPDRQDPCCNDQFVGGAVKARPFCRQRGSLLRGLYGSRNCSGNASSVSCGCGEVSCGEASCGVCDAGDYITSEHVGGSYSTVVPQYHGVQEGGCGCASCAPNSPMASRLSRLGNHPTGDSITAVARARQTTERAQRIRR